MEFFRQPVLRDEIDDSMSDGDSVCNDENKTSKDLTPFRGSQDMHFTEFEIAWNELKQFLTIIVRQEFVERSEWQLWFGKIHQLCVCAPPNSGASIGDGYAWPLYRRVNQLLEEYVGEIANELDQTSEEVFLFEYLRAWEAWVKAGGEMNYLLLHLNQNGKRKNSLSEQFSYRFVNVQQMRHDPQDERQHEILDLCKIIWRNVVINRSKEKLSRLLLLFIGYDRQQRDVGTFEKLRLIIKSLVDVDRVDGRRHNLETYVSVFEKAFINETGEFYHAESVRLLHNNSVSEYMRKVLQLIEEEDFRSKRLCNETSHAKVKREIQLRMVQDHLDYLVEQCYTMVHERNNKDLANMYQILRPAQQGIERMVEYVKIKVEKDMKSAIKKISKVDQTGSPTKGLSGSSKTDCYLGVKLVRKFLDVLFVYRTMNRKLFSNDYDIGVAIDKAVRLALNDGTAITAGKVPDMLARFCDEVLRNSKDVLKWAPIESKLLVEPKPSEEVPTPDEDAGKMDLVDKEANELDDDYCECDCAIKADPDAEFSNLPAEMNNERVTSPSMKGTVKEVENDEFERRRSLLNAAIELFGYVEDKEAFRKVYHTHLAKRLIYNISYSLDDEVFFVNQLREKCGFEFVNKIARMVGDTQTSITTMSKFRQPESTPSTLSYVFDVKILTTSAWPIDEKYVALSKDFILPLELRDSVYYFETFYAKEHNDQRALNWVYSLGDIHLRPTAKKDATMIVTVFQYAILNMFQSESSISYYDIVDAVGLPENDWRNHLLALINHDVLRPSNALPPLERAANCDTVRRTSRKKSLILTYNEELVFKNNILNLQPTVAKYSHVSEENQPKAEPQIVPLSDRKNAIQACIVRLMKKHQHLDHGRLVSNIRESLGPFLGCPKPSVRMEELLPANEVKTQIEQLIEKDYIKRDEKDPTLYHYVP